MAVIAEDIERIVGSCQLWLNRIVLFVYEDLRSDAKIDFVASFRIPHDNLTIP